MSTSLNLIPHDLALLSLLYFLQDKKDQLKIIFKAEAQSTSKKILKFIVEQITVKTHLPRIICSFEKQ